MLSPHPRPSPEWRRCAETWSRGPDSGDATVEAHISTRISAALHPAAGSHPSAKADGTCSALRGRRVGVRIVVTPNVFTPIPTFPHQGGRRRISKAFQPLTRRASSSRRMYSTTRSATSSVRQSNSVKPCIDRSQVSWRLASWRVAAMPCSRSAAASILPSR